MQTHRTSYCINFTCVKSFRFIIQTTRQPVKNYCTIYHLKSSFVYMFTSMVAVPLVCLIVAYGTIIVTVIRRRRDSHVTVEKTSASSGSSGDTDETGARSRRTNTRLIVTCIIITILAVVSWMPVYVLMYLRKYYHVTTNRHIHHYVIIIFYFHPVFNPLVYFFVDARFRAGFMRLFRRKKVGEENISMASVTKIDGILE